MARRDLLPWSAAVESTVADFITTAISEGMSRSATQSAIRDLGLSMSTERMRGLWEAAERATADVLERLPDSQIVPALDGLTAPAAMKIATDYVHNVELTGPGGRTRYLMVATNDPNLTAADIIGQAMEVGNDRSRYEQGTGVPPGGWTGGAIESSWHRA